MLEISLWAFIGTLFGINLGMYAGQIRWARNADDYRRIEFNGKLYKVSHSDK